jgi:hypothetical protein
MSNNFNIRMNICDDESVIYLRIPHTSCRRAVAGIMTLIVGFLGFIGLRVELSPNTNYRPNTEATQ